MATNRIHHTQHVTVTTSAGGRGILDVEHDTKGAVPMATKEREATYLAQNLRSGRATLTARQRRQLDRQLYRNARVGLYR